ncbi:MAG TPA: hypothetical protein VLA04_04080 [Verrucomicrobiae bacterium]|nr:hypothetical protein [Verrucomicrobiae bacterium]
MLTWFLDSFFPRLCVGCGKEGSWVCHSCRDWDREGWPREASPGVTAFAPFREKVVREGIHGLKYHGLHEVAEDLVSMAWPAGFSWGEEAVLVPVPTSLGNKKKRGYNQAELIARAIARRLSWSVDTSLLVKTAKGTLVGKDRNERLRGAGYVLRKGAVVPERRLILVDDLCTTGSTLAACREALGREAEAVTVAFENYP